MIRAIALATLLCVVNGASQPFPIPPRSPTIQRKIEPRIGEPSDNPEKPQGGFLPMESQVLIQKENSSYSSKGCGYRKLNGISPAIRNSARQTNFAELPWTVMIFHSNGRTPVFKCGGSLIDKDIVLTAAHCVKGLNVSHLSIRAGEWDAQSNAEPLPHQERKVANVSVHPDYAEEIFYNDLALLFLAEPVELAENVDTICLPDEESFDDVHCLASGWGKNEFGATGRYQVILKSVDLSIDPPKICQNILRTTRLGIHFTLHESFICASGVDGADTCTGDGGGPLICPLKSDPNRYAQVGVVSWGIGCNSIHIPGVYANVIRGRKWIDDTIASRKVSNPSFDSPNSEPGPDFRQQISVQVQDENSQEQIQIQQQPDGQQQIQVQQQSNQQQFQVQQQPQNQQQFQVQQQPSQQQPQVIVIHQQSQPNFQQPKFIVVGPPPHPFIPNFHPIPTYPQQPGVVVVQNYPRSNKQALNHNKN